MTGTDSLNAAATGSALDRNMPQTRNSPAGSIFHVFNVQNLPHGRGLLLRAVGFVFQF